MSQKDSGNIVRINIGCGLNDIKEGWVNADIIQADGVELWNILWRSPDIWIEQFDEALINHTLCLFSYDEVVSALKNVKDCLKKGGVLEVIDIDLLKAYECYEKEDFDGFPGYTGSIDERICKHLVGYGRKSIFTSRFMMELLQEAGYINTEIAQSANDLRPKQSFVVKATKP